MKTCTIVTNFLLIFLLTMQSIYATKVTNTTKNAEPLWNQLKDFQPTVEKKFVIIVPTYNNKDWYKNNLDSIFSQKYTNFRVIYIDDTSPDGTAQCVENYLQQKKIENKSNLMKGNRFIFLKNKVRNLAMANIYTAIQLCEDDEIAMVLDGDDWFAHDHVLTLLNKVYSKYDVWMTYGQYKKYPTGELGKCRQLPNFIFSYNAFREYDWVTSQIRTFYVWLFKKIKIADLMYENKFTPTTYDLAMMYPMLEMASQHIKFIPDIVYIYNRANVLNDSKVNAAAASNISFYFRSKTKYTALNTAG